MKAEHIAHFDRLKEIMFIGLKDCTDDKTISKLDNEVEFICGTLFKEIADEYMKTSDEPRISLDYYEGKLFSMKSAVREALGFDREAPSEQNITSNFEHFSYLVQKGLPR